MQRVKYHFCIKSVNCLSTGTTDSWNKLYILLTSLKIPRPPKMMAGIFSYAYFKYLILQIPREIDMEDNSSRAICNIYRGNIFKFGAVKKLTSRLFCSTKPIRN